MKKIVVKFGGSNLKSKRDISKIIKVITYYQKPIVIVISAFYGITDFLVHAIQSVYKDEKAISILKEKLIKDHEQIVNHYIEDIYYRHKVLRKISNRVFELEKYLKGIYYLGDMPNFAKDKILSYGERLSSLIFESILNFKNIKCKECLPETLGLISDGVYGNATVDFPFCENKVKEHLIEPQVYVVPGFYGISKDNKVTIFGRGGSDYTAAAIARCIDASSVDLWKDVYGFMSADPKLVSNPTVIKRLTYNEAAELSYFGARLIHPRTFEPLKEKQIPIQLFNIDDFNEQLEPVTIVNNKEVIKKDIIKSVTFSDDFGVLKLHGVGIGIKPGIMARVASRLNDEGINIKSIITSQTAINILLSLHDLKKSLKAVNSIGLLAVDKIDVFDDISLIAVVGEGILEKPGIAAKVFKAVSRHKINVRTISVGASDVAAYFIIDKKKRKRAVRSIHDEFFR